MGLGLDNKPLPYQVFIGQPEEFPVVRERGIILEPGLEHFVDISSYTATTDKSAEALDVKYRRVIFGSVKESLSLSVCPAQSAINNKGLLIFISLSPRSL